MRSRSRWVAFGAAGFLAVAATVRFVAGGDGRETEGEETADVATATVERRDLVERETFDGALGFADEQALSSSRAGTVTRIANEGATVKRGEVLYEVDERPTVLMLGSVPAYRPMSAGVEGTDVRQLQRNLLALGFDDGGDLEVTGEFDADTEDAVRDWQEDLGVERTGVVELGDVVFYPSARRMGSHAVVVGQPVSPSAQVASTTTLERVVTLDLEASEQDLVERGDRVQIEIPGGERVNGRVTSVARAAETDPEDPEAEPTVEVAIRLLDAVETDLDQSPVDVDVETSRAEGVLTVPVQALLALSEGGYALELVDGAGTAQLVGVDTGRFADGFVEVSGDGVSEGMQVVTAS